MDKETQDAERVYSKSDKELVWKKLSETPDPLLVTIRQAGGLSVSKRYILQEVLGFTADEVDNFLDGYSSGR